ncbi:hypothetical protein D1AOALGA4SA_6522 [Olavius algarvensis Delta 1 endosymbiont]|nr:hypothetical protein D1AOALGA4SA_6522 [Olavius algarvensis Delta 1 endosymbiont]
MVRLDSTAVRQAQALSKARGARRRSADRFYSAATIKQLKSDLQRPSRDKQVSEKYIKLNLIPIFVNACLLAFYKDANKYFSQYAQN